MIVKQLIIVLLLVSSFHAQKLIKSSGGTLSAPLFYNLAYYYEKTEQVRIKYNPIGSYGAINQVEKHFVDFISTEKPLSPSFLKKFNLIQFPTYFGSISIAYNLPNIKNQDIKISNTILADIFLGKITHWDNQKIKEFNQKVKLPHKKIVPIYRSDQSGTTYNFTNFLTKVSVDWKNKFGTKKTIAWPSGIGAVGNNGVAIKIKQTDYSLGYIENIYRKREKLPAISIQSLKNQWVKPSQMYLKEATNSFKFKSSNHFHELSTLPKAKNSYPIVVQGFTIIACKKLSKNNQIYPFFKWFINSADNIILELGYTPLSSDKKKIVLDYIENSNCI